MRLLLIDDDPRYRALVRHHVTCVWPEADVVAYNPVVRGRLQPEFLAQGYDAVLLDHDWAGGDGASWLRELAGRRDFAPVIYLAGSNASIELEGAASAGAFAALPKEKFDHEKFVAVICEASRQQQSAQQAWRSSPDAREAQTFGGAFIKGYRRIRQIASGSVSDLFLAESIAAGALVVFKVTRDVRKGNGVDQSLARFLQEYEIVRSIRHPNVVHIYDLGVTDDYAYLVMEYFARGDLRTEMKSTFSVRRSLEYARALAQALSAIHKAGILHRDVKPGNVMIRDDGSIALIDFGLAKHRALEMEITDKGMIFGTPYYMSPEQGHGRPLDSRSDLYSLGVMLYEMLVGEKPYVADSPMAILYNHAKMSIPRLPPHMAQLQPLIDRLLAKEPADRYENALQVVEAIIEQLRALKATELAA